VPQSVSRLTPLPPHAVVGLIVPADPSSQDTRACDELALERLLSRECEQKCRGFDVTLAISLAFEGDSMAFVTGSPENPLG
jgi:hypothetical protein